MGYVANASARSLAGGRNKIIGMHTVEPVFPTTSVHFYFYFPFLLGMEQAAAELGYDLLLFTSAGGERQIFRDGSTRLSSADGALLLGRDPNVEEIERLRDSGYPFVYVGHREVSGASVPGSERAGRTRSSPRWEADRTSWTAVQEALRLDDEADVAAVIGTWSSD